MAEQVHGLMKTKGARPAPAPLAFIPRLHNPNKNTTQFLIYSTGHLCIWGDGQPQCLQV